MNSYSIVVQRPWEKGTFAHVRWSSSTVMTGDELLSAIRTAVTAWVREDGARVDFEDDYNVGDLSSDLGDERLAARLAEEDVHDLSIATASDLAHHNWDFDNTLIKEAL